jgi:hypothetical protein
MANQLFREKSMEKVSSPEQLNDYIRVSNPGVWIALTAVIVLLVGVCVWGIFGRLETTVGSAAVVKDGVMTLYIKEEHLGKITEGMTVRVKDQEYLIAAVETVPKTIPEGFDEYMLHLSGMHVGEWVFGVTAMDTNLADGVYKSEIVVESVAPMSFILG